MQPAIFMNKPRDPLEMGADIKWDCFFNLTEKVLDAIIVELNKIICFVYIH